MSLFHRYGSYFYKPEGALARLMFSRMARTVSSTFVHIYSPAFIFKTLFDRGFDYKAAVIFVLVYYLFASVVNIVTQYLAENVSRKVGFKNIIRLSLLPFLVFIALISKGPDNHINFLWAAFFWGLHSGFYWWGYHGYFVKKGQKKHFGTSIGEANLLETIASILTPLVGAGIVALWGFESLFGFSLIFVVMSIFLLGGGSRTRQVHDIKAGDLFILLKKHRLTALAYIGMGSQSITTSIIWPLFLYLFFGEVISLGAIVSMSAFIAAVFSVIIGSQVDADGGRDIVKIGSLVLFSSWILRVISRSMGIFIMSDSLGNFGHRMISVPLNTLSYKKAIEAETAKAILFLETTQVMGVVITLTVLIILVSLNSGLRVAFLVAAIFSLFPLFWTLKKR